MNRMIRKAMSSAMKVALGTRKLLSASTVEGCAIDLELLLLGEHENEQHREGEVDEVHRLHQTDGEEEQRLQPALGLRLAGDARDQRATGQTVTDSRANRAATEGHAAADEGTGKRD